MAGGSDHVPVAAGCPTRAGKVMAGLIQGKIRTVTRQKQGARISAAAAPTKILFSLSKSSTQAKAPWTYNNDRGRGR